MSSANSRSSVEHRMLTQRTSTATAFEHQRRLEAAERASGEAFDAAKVYDAYAPFVWRCLQRMGVPEADLEDSLQEVFVVVHRKLGGYCAERAKLSTWLFGIGVNVARKHRSKKRRLVLGFDLEDVRSQRPGPDQELQHKQDAQRLQAVLSRLKPEHSATFVMFELEGLSCHEIADLTGVPVGTVYSRLHKARAQFRALVHQLEKAEQRLRGTRGTGA